MKREVLTTSKLTILIGVSHDLPVSRSADISFWGLVLIIDTLGTQAEKI